jgi:hypothetical protein
MRLKVNLLASKCIFGHACLENNVHKPCEVKECVNEKVVFIKCEPRMCGYHINFGYEKICLCPTRKEIFEKYNQ